ncbi:unnamed protein product [Ranitomeya imitator]|uniref:Uncharacterized protein n=1 Tax=Ranitomeya imitator TaxID=111125 RepID=A0ABN9M3R0_9NEOB|nr:unnamed protein product [Ranitomeya imitator]
MSCSCFRRDIGKVYPPKATLAKWIRSTIQESYRIRNTPVPAGIKAHSTRSVGASWAIRHQASAQQLCKAATWSNVKAYLDRLRQMLGIATTAQGHWSTRVRHTQASISWRFKPVSEDETRQLRSLKLQQICDFQQFTDVACSFLQRSKVHRCFKLHVESCRKAGHAALGLEAVTLWIRALRSQVTQQMTEPVTQWVKIKIDGARNGDEDLHLHTLKDGLADNPLDPELMISLLATELKGYKSVHGTHRTGALQYNLTALDAVQNCLRLLDSALQGLENQKHLLDIKAQALLWHYICTLEANMREGLEEEQRKEKLDAQRQWSGVEYEPNDLNYEDKLLDNLSARDGICFTLAGEAGPMKGLNEALDLWRSLLSGPDVPSLHSSEQTVFSLHLLGSLFRLMGKFPRDHIRAAGALCHLTKLLFYLEGPEYARVTLQEAEAALLQADTSSEIYVLTNCWFQLHQSHLFRVTDQRLCSLSARALGATNRRSIRRSQRYWQQTSSSMSDPASPLPGSPPPTASPQQQQKRRQQKSYQDTGKERQRSQHSKESSTASGKKPEAENPQPVFMGPGGGEEKRR